MDSSLCGIWTQSKRIPWKNTAREEERESLLSQMLAEHFCDNFPLVKYLPVQEWITHRNRTRIEITLSSNEKATSFWEHAFHTLEESCGIRPWREGGTWQKLCDIQGSPPPSSTELLPNELEVRQNYQEACVDEQVAPSQTHTQKRIIHKKGSYTG